MLTPGMRSPWSERRRQLWMAQLSGPLQPCVRMLSNRPDQLRQPPARAAGRPLRRRALRMRRSGGSRATALQGFLALRMCHSRFLRRHMQQECVGWRMRLQRRQIRRWSAHHRKRMCRREQLRWREHQ